MMSASRNGTDEQDQRVAKADVHCRQQEQSGDGSQAASAVTAAVAAAAEVETLGSTTAIVMTASEEAATAAAADAIESAEPTDEQAKDEEEARAQENSNKTGSGMAEAAAVATASYWMRSLRLEPHPLMSGGFFKETYKDPTQVQVETIDGKTVLRPLSTLIYYLHLPTHTFNRSTLFYQSRCSSVMMHHYSGQPCSLYFLASGGSSVSGRKKAEAEGDAKVDDHHQQAMAAAQEERNRRRRLGLRKIRLGSRGPEFGETCQAVIIKGTWFTRILESDNPKKDAEEGEAALESSDYSLVGVTVAPGFHYDDLKMATYDTIMEYHKDLYAAAAAAAAETTTAASELEITTTTP